jgi:WD40 repeat protein
MLPLRGTHSVTSVAFSLDGMRIASGSDDCTVRVWDAATGDAVAGPFRPIHTGGVKCVGLLRLYGKQIGSGSWDETVRVWDVETGSLTS